MAKQKEIWTNISWDWKWHPDLGDLRKTLKPFGIHVYEDPIFQGSDTYGFIFSNKKLTKKDLNKYEKDFLDSIK
jgi:hypothetical protein